jgi:hypothetical protein
MHQILCQVPKDMVDRYLTPTDFRYSARDLLRCQELTFNIHGSVRKSARLHEGYSRKAPDIIRGDEHRPFVSRHSGPKSMGFS